MRKKIISYLLLLGLLLLPLSSSRADNSKAGEEIDWQVLSSGGAKGNSNSFILQGTTGQTATQKGGSESFLLKHGFWQKFGRPCQGKCGDANNDDKVNVSDAVYVINFVFSGGNPPKPVLACGDSNTDGRVNVSDAVHLINFVFSGGNQPGNCSPGDEDWTDGDCCEFVL